MLPFAALAKVAGKAKIVSSLGPRGKVAWAAARKQPTEDEIKAAMAVSEHLGAGIYLRGNMRKGADAFLNGVRFYIKTITGKNGFYSTVRESVNKGQATRFIIDGRKSGLTDDVLASNLKSLATRGKKWDEIIVIMGNGRIRRLPEDLL